MRLEKIKLAGFKSFVDPTTVHFNSSLVGVVGPNGCGKSNIIDAVRWVMGESSAKMLRGESMADVIFNGSSSRKPVGNASIELLFDNGDGSAGGQYAEFSQISVKRQVSRDGQSLYWLNNVRCRRRDIADLFLGTGLGPRSYAIIEQGMISRIIEARPEELRNYLEEAAGISRYKERRRETERRIEHTRENLDRLNDLRDEVQKQLRHLERQAATAEKYRALKEEERRVQAELLVLRLDEYAADLALRDRDIAEKENLHQAAIARQRQLEAEIERQRNAHAEANDAFNGVQARFYAIGADIARLEEAIQFARETRSQQEAELRRIELTLAEAHAHRDKDSGELDALAAALAEGAPQLVAAEQVERGCAERMTGVETALSTWQSEWDEFSAHAAEPAQNAQVERARLTHLEQQEGELKARHERLQRERDELKDQALDAEIGALIARERETRAVIARNVEMVSAAAAEINDVRAQLAGVEDDLNGRRQRLEEVKGRLASLDALQQAAGGADETARDAWLESRGLGGMAQVMQELRVEPDWRIAVETVLRERLMALCVADPGRLVAKLEDCASALDLLDDDFPATAAVTGTLAAEVTAPAALIAELNLVRTAASATAAWQMRDTLAPGESVVTTAGLWIGPGWVRWPGDGDADGGALTREAERRQLRDEATALDADVAELGGRLKQLRDRLAECEQARAEAQSSADETNRALTEISGRLGARQAQAEQIGRRMSGLEQELEETGTRVEQTRLNMAKARERLHASLAEMDTLGQRRQALTARRDALRSELDAARAELGAARDAMHRIALRVESIRSKEQSLRGGIDRAARQLDESERRRDELTQLLASAVDPLAEQQRQLESHLESRVQVESDLGEARRTLESIDQSLREHEQQRQQIEGEVQAERARVEEGRMARQEVLVRAKTVQEQLDAAGFEREALAAALDAEASAAAWQERAEKLATRIQRLGPINLAAIDEFREQSERMTYLDQQYDDINESLNTLESAIRKIDKETRTRFKETFDKVDAGLKEIFPKLFGGGHAYLELTGEDLLDTGVAVMARPPGKRNTNIHLLSGGEKALAAVALVFAIFELNPAPFCMLDEVDAPLDDANVDRYSALVREMSERVQLIFITHNKVTMEVADHLIGVTMHEPGVSRMVSVDVDAAVAMAAS